MILAFGMKAAMRPGQPILFLEDRELSFKVRIHLLHLNKLIAVAEKSMQADYQYRSEQLVRTDQGHLPIGVSKSNLARALRIIDTLMKCRRRRQSYFHRTERNCYRQIGQKLSGHKITRPSYLTFVLFTNTLLFPNVCFFNLNTQLSVS